MTADHAGQTGGEREVCGCALVLPDSRNYVGPHHANGCLLFPGQIAAHAPSRPVPVPGQASRERDTERDTIVSLAAREFEPGLREVTDATVSQTASREAAVEAVARWLCAYLAPNFPGGLDAMDDGPGHPFRLRAMQILDLPAVAALSAAPALSECSVSTTDALSAVGGQET